MTEHEPYTLRLAARLQSGLAGLPAARRKRHAEFVRSFQQPDGGFRGRDGEADLYYTSFAIRALTMLDSLDTDLCSQLAAYLRQHDPRQLNTVDLLSWLYSALIVQTAAGHDLFEDQGDQLQPQLIANLNRLRRPDGGFAKAEAGAAGSTYHSFLAMLAFELLGTRVPRPNSLVQFVYDRQRDDGGFVEIAPMKRSGTNPTAAAVAILLEYHHVDLETRDDVTAFLREARSGEGGFQANTQVPFADALSTFTGLLTLRDLQLDGVLLDTHAREFVEEWLEFPTGGFRAASWDDQADVEYTFYGLGVLSLVGPSDHDVIRPRTVDDVI